MRHLIEIGLALLPLDAPSRRALDETLTDWAHEVASAPTRLGRCWCAARSFLSVVYALSAIAVREVTAVPRSRALMRLAVYVASSVVVFVFACRTCRTCRRPSPSGFGPASTWRT